MLFQKITDLFNRLADTLRRAFVLDAVHDNFDDVIPLIFRNFFIDAAVGQNPDFMFENRDKNQNPGFIPGAV